MMTSLPHAMSGADAELPEGYRRPMSCRLMNPDDVALDLALRPISVQQIEDLVNELEADPRRVAVRMLELERDQDIMRAHLETIEQRLGVR